MAQVGDRACAVSEELVLIVGVAATTLRVALLNRGEATVTVHFAADGPDRRHHDFLTARLAGAGGVRTLRFSGDRNASSVGVASLAAGEEVTDELDLAVWALAAVNGATALAGGAHELTATYRVDQPGAWSGSIRAGPVAMVVR